MLMGGQHLMHKPGERLTASLRSDPEPATLPGTGCTLNVEKGATLRGIGNWCLGRDSNSHMVAHTRF